MQPATQADVAQLAGVARKTVSNVINDYPHISPGVRERVLAAINQLGYRPSHAARSLRSGRSRMIGLVIPELDVPYFAELGRLIVEEAESHGVTVLILQTRGDRQRELDLIFGDYAGIVDGLIYSPVALTGADLPSGPQRTPLVLLGERSSDGLIDHIGIDNVAAAQTATEHLLSLGRRRIAFIGGQPEASSEMARQRLLGYRAALTAGSVAFDPKLIVNTDGYHRSNGANAVERLIEARADFDALFCATDLLAHGAMRALHESGRAIPQDVAVVGFDDLDESRYSTPTLTTISPDKRQIAETAVSRLLTQADESTRKTVNTTTAYSLVVREST